MIKTQTLATLAGLVLAIVGITCESSFGSAFARDDSVTAERRKNDRQHVQEQSRPNIVFIFSDDHALNAISAYGGRLKDVAPTPNIDRIAKQGAIFRNSFCANSICGPSRACILTGKHSHINRFMRNGNQFDASQWTFVKDLQSAGYTTSLIGKWHLKSDPIGFDHWEVLPGQGAYYNPDFVKMDGTRHRVEGYCTDIITEKSIKWLDSRNTDQPFLLMCQHKAPHRTFSPALRHLDDFDGIEIPEPDTLFDDYQNRSVTLKSNEMSLSHHFDWMYDLKLRNDEREGIELPGPNRYRAVEYSRMNGHQKKRLGRPLLSPEQNLSRPFYSGRTESTGYRTLEIPTVHEKLFGNRQGRRRKCRQDTRLPRSKRIEREYDCCLLVGPRILPGRTRMV